MGVHVCRGAKESVGAIGIQCAAGSLNFISSKEGFNYANKSLSAISPLFRASSGACETIIFGLWAKQASHGCDAGAPQLRA
jgi:hypothetical protein